MQLLPVPIVDVKLSVDCYSFWLRIGAGWGWQKAGPRSRFWDTGSGRAGDQRSVASFRLGLCQRRQRIVKRPAFRYTPEHPRWLDMAEIEFSALTRACLMGRYPDVHSPQRATTVKRYSPPTTLCDRLIQHDATGDEMRAALI